MSKQSYGSAFGKALLGVCAAVASLGLSGCPVPGKSADTPVEYGTLRLLARLPENERTRVTTVELSVETLGGKKEVQQLMPWAVADTLRLPVGSKSISFVARDASGLPVWRTTRGAFVVPNYTLDVAVDKWDKAEFEQSRDIGIASAVTALLLGLLVGVGEKANLGYLVFRHRLLLLPLALVLGMAFSAAAVMVWEGSVFISAYGLPSGWLLMIAMGAASLMLLSVRFHVLTIPLIDCLLVGVVLGGAATVGCLGWPMVQSGDAPWLQMLGIGTWASVIAAIVLHERR